jgi:gamma-glutamyltranspeptidase/glutathione hydrolase
MGTQSAVVAGHPLAAAAGSDVLRRGGNAVDAAVTMAAVMAVVRPHMNGIGADAFSLIYDGKSGKMAALNGSGRAGSLATPEHFAELNIEKMPGSGAATVTVPGAVSAWAAALEKYGTISLAEALAPAIHYAEDGFPVSKKLHDDLAGGVERLNEGGRAIYAPNGRVPEPGELLKNPALARSLRLIAKQGPSAFYGGSIAKSIVEFLKPQGGLLELRDFANHKVEWTEPLCTDYHAKRVCTMPPNSQGVALLQQLAMGEQFDLAGMGHNSAAYLHTLVELKKLAFADRDRWVADPAFASVPVDRMLAPDYLKARARFVGDSAAANVEPGFTDQMASEPAPGDGDTVFLMDIDQWGNGVTWVQSLFASFGSKLVDPSTGIVLQNRGAGFTLEAGHPDRIAPGKRPFHTLTPVQVTDAKGRLEMTIGTPGGHGQTQTLTQVLDNIYLFGMTPQEAVESPRFQSFNGRSLAIEDRIPADVRKGLEERGHKLRVIEGWSGSFGGAQIIRTKHSPRILWTGADPRREAYAVAY